MNERYGVADALGHLLRGLGHLGVEAHPGPVHKIAAAARSPAELFSTRPSVDVGAAGAGKPPAGGG